MLPTNADVEQVRRAKSSYILLRSHFVICSQRESNRASCSPADRSPALQVGHALKQLRSHACSISHSVFSQTYLTGFKIINFEFLVLRTEAAVTLKCC